MFKRDDRDPSHPNRYPPSVRKKRKMARPITKWRPNGAHAEALRRAACVKTEVDPETRRLVNHHGTLRREHHLTIDLYAKVINMVRANTPITISARACGLTTHAIAQYARLAEDPEAHPFYALFQKDLAQAVADVADQNFRKMEEIGDRTNDWRPFHERLKIMDPDLRPDTKLIVESHVANHINILFAAIEREIPSEHFQRILEIAATLGPGTGTTSGSSGRRG